MLRTACIALLTLAILVGCGQGAWPKAVKPPVTAPFPVPVVELQGTPGQMGDAHAQRLGEPIRGLFSAYFTKYFESDFHRNLALLAAMAFQKHVSPAHLAEINAIASATTLNPRQVMLGQCFLDLSDMVTCSTITLPASAAPDGVARFGRNLDFPSLNVADKGSVLLIFRPDDGRYAFASVAWPGMIGVLSGMNEHGLALANMEVDRPRRLPMAMPYTLLYRTVLERCRTVEEAIELLRKTPRQTANNLMLMDAAGDRAVVEITRQSLYIRRAPADEALISTNHQRGEDLDTAGRCPRFDFLHDASAGGFGQISVARLEKMLGAVAQGKMTLQSMIFEPSSRVIYLAVGANAPRKGYHKLALGPLFERAGVGDVEEKTALKIGD